MDLEEIARKLYGEGKPKEDIVKGLTELTGSEEKAEAIFTETAFIQGLEDSLAEEPDPLLELLTKTHESGLTAESAGLGCRGSGDQLIHQLIARIIGRTQAVVDATEGDDGGVVRLPNTGKTLQGEEEEVALAVDGVHSRLSHYPFLAGFHVARAALRDVIAMGAQPFALFSDIHLGNDGDPAKVFDYVAGISTVAEAAGVPYICGSTLRIGGDLVLGDRLTGSAGAAGLVVRPEVGRRTAARPGDLLIMTEGAGGGTISTTAIFNGLPHLLKETMDIDFIELGMALLKQPHLMDNIHALMDITNGGIRGDMIELAASTGLKVEIHEDRVLKLVNPRVLAMLELLEIDPLGISTDSMLLTVHPDHAWELLGFIKGMGFKAGVVGKVMRPPLGKGGEVMVKGKDGGFQLVDREFREAPYTPIKKLLGSRTTVDLRTLNRALKDAARASSDKKRSLLEELRKREPSRSE